MPYKDKKDKKKHDTMWGKKTIPERVDRNTARRRELKKGIDARALAAKQDRPLTDAEKSLPTKGDNTHTDHIVALSKGGGNSEKNTRTVPAKENLKKYNKTTGTA